MRSHDPIVNSPGPLFEQDPCQRKHGGNPQSVAAHERIRPHKACMRDTLLQMIGEAGDEGATLLELASLLGVERSSISGRLTELKRSGRVRQKLDELSRPVVRAGAAVLIAREWTK